MEPGRAHRRRRRCSSPRSGQDAPFGSKKFQAQAPMPLILNSGTANARARILEAGARLRLF